MNDFSLDYSKLGFEDPHSGKILRRLLTLACTKAGICVKDKKILIESVPQEKGCIILLTITPKIHRKVYKIKKQKQSISFVFAGVEPLIAAAKAVSFSKFQPLNSVYMFDDKYAVIIENTIENKRFFALLREFSHKTLYGKIHAARIKENGKLLSNPKGLSIIGNHFAQRNTP